ncbi:NUDIX hydrolase [Gordonia tangerina]|jgi:ADP-ribose pyrophosphatase YjhB (NUDIX family)|uniref:NUDIX hydrolase n=1 Tax=Gordonia tangerina TaxID=2911060 RepID=A0ABS9DH48_9ACTN|nr:NUDIX hydrolase [Gordonia tangerina]MCF3938428.1 NUDIX hydrolase [Gordonia tangerina]
MPTPPPSAPSTGGPPVEVETLTAVFQVRDIAAGAEPALCVLLADDGNSAWRLPGGAVAAEEPLDVSARRAVADTVEITTIAHLEQLAVFSDPARVPGIRTIASTYLGLVPSDAPTELAVDSAWHAVDHLPALAYDHDRIVDAARHRLAAKLSYTNIAFALAPARFPMSQLSEIYCAALGYPVDTTNLLRILSRRAVVVATGTVGKTGRTGGRPPALYAFADAQLRVTDEFATLRPPM